MNNQLRNKESNRLNKILTPNFLFQSYIINKKSTPTIAKEIQCSTTTILHRLTENNIKIRTKSESNIGLKRAKITGYRIRRSNRLNPQNKIIRQKNIAKVNTLPRTKKQLKVWRNCYKHLHKFWTGSRSKKQLIQLRKLWKLPRTRKQIESSRKVALRINQIIDRSGEKHPNWLGGISFEPYGIEFNAKLKEKIRRRDGYKCSVCNTHEKQARFKLTIHHIDYNKQNNKPKNLISVCISCHTKTNYNRDYWYAYFLYKIEEIYNGK